MSQIDETLLPTAEDIRFYEENGYWIGPKVLDDAQIERMRHAMDEVYAGHHETGRPPWQGGWQATETSSPLEIRKSDNSYWSNNTIRELALNPTVAAMAARLSGASVLRLWHDQLLYKPGSGPAAAREGNVGWHQDSSYWPAAPFNLITAWVALDDVTAENGCMQFIPGSHKLGILAYHGFTKKDREEHQRELESLGLEFRTVNCVLKAGQFSLHHSLTMHGSGPNLTHVPRRSLVIHMMPGDTIYPGPGVNDTHMNMHLLKEKGIEPKAGDPFAPPGPIGDELFPVIYPPGG